MIRFPALCLALALSAAAALPFAAEANAGDVTIDNAWARATPKGADIGAGYFVIHNEGATPDRLVGGAADFAAVEIHEVQSQDGMMKMRELKNGLNIPARAAIRFAPGGYHVMFTHLTKPLEKGETISATFNFEHAGSVKVDFPVQAVGAGAPAKKDDMKGMKM